MKSRNEHALVEARKELSGEEISILLEIYWLCNVWTQFCDSQVALNWAYKYYILGCQNAWVIDMIMWES